MLTDKLKFILALAALWTLWCAASFYAAGRGVLHVETSRFIPHYTDSGKTLAARVFDPRFTEGTHYQGRELSYLVDMGDANFITATSKIFGMHFHPAMHYLLTGLLCALLAFSLRGRPWTALPLCLAVLVTPPLFIVPGMFRSAKILTGLFLCSTILLIWAHVKNGLAALPGKLRANPANAALPVFASALLMGLSDRQGFACTFILAAVLLAWIAVSRRKDAMPLAGGLLAAAVVCEIYNRLLGPGIISYVTGCPASFDYQQISYRDALFSSSFLSTGLRMTLTCAGYVAGSTGLGGGFLLLSACLLAPALSRGQAKDKRLFVVIFISACIAGTAALNAVLQLRHPPIGREGVLITYYSIPQVVFITLGLLMALECVPKLERKAWFLFLLLAAGNVLSLGKNTRQALQMAQAPIFAENTVLLRRCLRGEQVTFTFFPSDYEKACLFLRDRKGLRR